MLSTVCGSVGWKSFSFGEKTVKFKYVMEAHPEMHRNMDCLSVLQTLVGSSVVSSWMAGRLRCSSIKTSGSSFGREKATDLSNSAVAFLK